MKIRIHISLAICLMFAGRFSYAHPVSYQGGTMITGTYAPDWVQSDINYTFSRSDSAGLSQFRLDDGESDKDYIIPRLSHRWRENGAGHQANLYITAGVGARIDSGDQGPVGYAAIQADYETRRIYSLGLAETIIDQEEMTHLQYRLGFAPYKTDFEGLSTWLIGQLDYKPYHENDRLTFTPLVRLFIGSVLAEAGVSLEGQGMLTFMYSF